MEPWQLTWRVMSVPRTGPCGSTTWWDRWIFGRERLAYGDRLAHREGRQASSLSHASKSIQVRLKPSLSTSIDRSHVRQAAYLTNKTCEQGRGIVFSPRQSKPQRNVQIDHGQNDNGCRRPPACASKHPSHAQPGRHET